MAASRPGNSKALWDFFCSLKLTIAVLILLATTSILGTVIQQNRSREEYLQAYSETTYQIFDALQFFDMYHSWWFVGLLGVFCLNLVACTVRRLPRVWKTVRQPKLVADDALFRTLSNTEEQTVDEPLSAVRDRLASFLGKQFGAPVVTEDGERVHLYAEKGAYARFGVYVTHLSILVIFIGAIIGNLWGYKAYVNIPEGSATDKVWPRGSDEPIDLGFSVRADDFNVTYYPGTSRPKEFMSILDVVDGGREVVSDRKIIVNDPLTYKGITFYQSSYGPAGDPTFSMKVATNGGEPRQMTARLGEQVPLPNGGSFAVTNFTPSYQQYGPAAQLRVNSPEGRPGKPFVVLQNFADFDARRGGDFVFSLLGYEQPQYTGLQVAKDPGVWVVWVGCALMVVGCYVAFFLSHRRIWVALRPDGGRTRVTMGGSAHRNQPGFELFFDDFRQKFRHELDSKIL
ncbi:MAG: cytochrome c biogenesis protein ResB [Desulfuromonadales bacterium]|nr:cytochrome c biogenesis protein ResB [Desulfuromonadales bacterium]NIR33670.1 cytochrome c biogenesis protein ResB [Desulfuromonadales bacterium]NIS41280.1 cytochrome c biogenesis protein ResB [Desulfuromonadales bacterium]